MQNCSRSLGITGLRLAIAAFWLILFTGIASAQMCPPPYAQAVSAQTGDVCTSTCAPGSFPVVEGAGVACKPGYATPTCPEGDQFLVMTAGGPTCQQGYKPEPAATGGASCKPGDLRLERPPYELNGSIAYETCVSGPSCPAGYIEAVDPDNALGSSRVCLLPCQDFVMNQSMACSCGSGGRLAAQEPGAPVKQICEPSCPAGTQWAASSPLYAFKAQEGQCIPTGGGEPVAVSAPTPHCPGATYWNGQVCLPIGGSGGIFLGCPAGTHWNGSHCVLNIVLPPKCPPGTHWNGLFCVPNAPKPCPIFMKWDGNKCVPIVQKVCPPNQFWNGTKCVPKLILCPAPKKWINGKCVLPILPPPQLCAPPKKWINGKCVLPVLPPPKLCPAPKKWINGKCVLPVLPPPKLCPAPKKWINGKCV